MKCSTECAGGTRGGFTIVELLVVIAVLLVLAVLVFVGASRARDAAHATVCMNNMREVATDHIALCNENNGVIPHAYRTRIKDGWIRNWQLHHTVLRHEDLTWRESTSVLNERLKTMTHLQCPLAFRLNREGMEAQSGFRAVGTYAMNGLIGRDEDPDSSRGWIRGAETLVAIKDPSKLVMLTEKAWNGRLYGSATGPVAPVHVFAEFHGGGFHASFFDGHVEKATHGEFPINTRNPPLRWREQDFMDYWMGVEEMRPVPQ